MKQVVAVVLAAVFLASGCSARVAVQQVTLSTGQVVDYVHGRTDSKGGQEVAYRDVWQDGKLIDTKATGGSTLAFGITQGAVSSAMIAGGMVGAAALLRPTQVKNVETNNLNNDQAQVQGQGQEQRQGQVAVSASEATAVAKARANNVNVNSNSNTNNSTSNGGSFCFPPGHCGHHGNPHDD